MVCLGVKPGTNPLSNGCTPMIDPSFISNLCWDSNGGQSD